jgi:hypothetical protein
MLIQYKRVPYWVSQNKLSPQFGVWWLKQNLKIVYLPNTPMKGWLNPEGGLWVPCFAWKRYFTINKPKAEP